MQFSLIHLSKKALLTAALTIGCLGYAAVGFAEAKAMEFEHMLRSTYYHSMSNEFAQKVANMYNAYNPDNSWGELRLSYESGMDGSVSKYWYIGDLRRGNGSEFVLQVKRKVTSKRDSNNKEVMYKIEDTSFALPLYPQDEESFKLGDKRGVIPTDALGDYKSNLNYPQMSYEAAMYVLERYLKSVPKYRAMLEGAAMVHTPNGENHEFKLVEQHPDHVVTRGQFSVIPTGDILEYDVVMDRWYQLTR